MKEKQTGSDSASSNPFRLVVSPRSSATSVSIAPLGGSSIIPVDEPVVPMDMVSRDPASTRRKRAESDGTTTAQSEESTGNRRKRKESREVSLNFSIIFHLFAFTSFGILFYRGRQIQTSMIL
jgi:hypothetical protein